MSTPHLSPDEIVARVFPHEEGPAPVPIHLAVCPECQARVARIREGFLTDRGAVDGAVEALPPEYWNRQAEAVMSRVSMDGAGEPVRLRFPTRLTRSLLRRPAIALGSVAAALLLVTGITLLRPSSLPEPLTSPVALLAEAGRPGGLSPRDAADDDLLCQVDLLLTQESPFYSLLPEVMP